MNILKYMASRNIHLFHCMLLSTLIVYLKIQVKSLSSPTYSYCDIYDNITCANGGLLEYTADTGFACKCTPNYYGENCTQMKFLARYTWIFRVINSATLDLGGKPTMWWSILPFTSTLELKHIYSFHQQILTDFGAFSTVNRQQGPIINITTTRILPTARPIPCSNKNLPPLHLLYNQIFERTPEQRFKPDPKNRNLLFHAFYQYFVLQFLNSDFNMTVTASQLYGADETTQRHFRTFANGKLKTEYLNNEHYPPFLTSAKRAKMHYPPMSYKSIAPWYYRIQMRADYKTQKPKWDTGHPLSGTSPTLFAMSTLWVREHNRVCDFLAGRQPSWTDERIFVTAKRIVIGEMMTIMMGDVINVHAGHSFSFKLKPELCHGRIRDENSLKNTPFELLLTSMWPSSLPDKLDGVPLDTTLFGNNKQVILDGLSKTVKAMVGQKMGMVTYNNDGAATQQLTRFIINLAREGSTQSFNSYRRKMSLYAYESFYELTRNREVAHKLENLYNHVDDVELLTGLLTEKTKNGFAPTISIMMNSYIVNSILTSSITSRELWVPDTFGGNDGFDMVKNANIETFVCNNLADKCNDLTVSLYAL